MFNLVRFGLSVILVSVCSNAAVAAVKSAAPNGAARLRSAQVVLARAEVARDETFIASDFPLLDAAQAVSDASVEQSSTARDKASALASSAASLRRVAYDLTNQPGLSAVQNRKMVAAMEAADAAESAAGVAQTSANGAAVTADGSRRAVERLTAQIAGLQQRIAVCNAFIRSNDFAMRPGQQSFPDLPSVAHATAR